MKKVLILSLAIVLLFPSPASASRTRLDEEKVPCIVEFDLPPLLEVWKDSSGNGSIKEYKERLRNLHERFLEWLGRFTRNTRSRSFFRLLNGMMIEIPKGIIPLMRNLPYVKRVYPDIEVCALLNRSLPLIRLHDAIRVHNLDGSNVTIAVIDTGIDYNHPDLRHCYLGGYDFVNDDNDPYDDNGHGTHVCGIIAGDGNASSGAYRGVAPGVNLVVYKALDGDGRGCLSTVLEAMERALDPNNDSNLSDHVDVVSLSFGVADAGREGDPDGVLSKAVDRLVDAGIIVVTAAGNSGWNTVLNIPAKHTICSPACARKSIAVGAVTHIIGSSPSGGPDRVALYSSKGPSPLLTVKPDIVAPGGDIDVYLDEDDPDRYRCSIVSARARDCRIGKDVNEYYVKLGGTSMAAPHVTGLIALLLEEHPDWDPHEVRSALRYTAVDLGYPLSYQGFGRVDAYNLLNLTSPPPVAFFFDCKRSLGKIRFEGMARSRCFYRYEVYCRYLGRVNPDEFYTGDDGWRLIYIGDKEIDDGTIFEWNTTYVEEGWYEIKLVVKDTLGRESEDYIIVDVEKEPFLIEMPDEVKENQRFEIKVKDKDNRSVFAIYVMTSLFRIPRIDMGWCGEFRAYKIRLDAIRWIRARIWIIIPYHGKIYVIGRSLTILNR